MMPEFGLDFETGASALYKTRVSERMSWEESAIFFSNLAILSHIREYYQPLSIVQQKLPRSNLL